MILGDPCRSRTLAWESCRSPCGVPRADGARCSGEEGRLVPAKTDSVSLSGCIGRWTAGIMAGFVLDQLEGESTAPDVARQHSAARWSIRATFPIGRPLAAYCLRAKALRTAR